MEVITERVLEATQPRGRLREAILYDRDSSMLYLVSEKEVMDSKGLLFRKELRQIAITPWEAEEEIARIATEPEEAKKRLYQILSKPQDTTKQQSNGTKPATPKQKAFLRDLLKKAGKDEGWIKERTGKDIDELTSKEISALITELQ